MYTSVPTSGEDLIEISSLSTLLEARHGDQGVLCLHQVVLRGHQVQCVKQPIISIIETLTSCLQAEYSHPIGPHKSQCRVAYVCIGHSILLLVRGGSAANPHEQCLASVSNENCR